MSPHEFDIESDPDRLFDQIRDYVRTAREYAERGEYFELAGFDNQVRRLCLSIQSLDKSRAQEYFDELTFLMQQLNELQDIFLEARDGLANEMQGLNTHKKASSAYAKSQSIKPGEKKGE